MTTKTNRKRKPDNRSRNRNQTRKRHQSQRVKESRANESTHAKSLRPTVDARGGLLDLPKPPKGIIYHWINMEIHGEKSQSFDARMREGWKPIRPSSLPAAFQIHAEKVSGYGDVIRIRGDIAMQMSEEQFRVNEKVYEDKAKNDGAASVSEFANTVGRDFRNLSQTRRTQVQGHTIPAEF